MCDAQRVELTFDGGSPQEAAYGTPRGDTRQVCGDTDNGFGLLFNWNLLGAGSHHVVAYADGVEFARVDVTVTTLGTEFRRGLSRVVGVPDFPAVGTDVVLRWQEAQQNFVIIHEFPTQRLVAVTPSIALPVGVQIPNVVVASPVLGDRRGAGESRADLVISRRRGRHRVACSGRYGRGIAG